MATTDISITEAELREAFNRSGLRRDGYTFQRAVNTESIYRCLSSRVKHWHKAQQQNGKPAPVQQALL